MCGTGNYTMKPNPIIFLDIDGVLNSITWFKKCGGMTRRLDPVAVAQLRRIVDATKADIVIASTWRKFTPMYKIIGALRQAKYSDPNEPAPPVIGKTPVLEYMSRATEIEAWQFQNPQRMLRQTENGVLRANFVWIDDVSELVNVIHPIVVTDTECGLTASDADKAIELLLLP